MAYNNTNGDLASKTILLVNTGSVKKKFIIQRLKSLGLKIVVLIKEKNWAEPYVDYWILADTFNHVESIQSIKTFLDENSAVKIDGVLTFWEDDVLLASKIADKFNFIGIPFKIANQARNKFLFREFCRSHGLPAPQYKLIKKKEDLKLVIQTFKFPLVIKPVYGASSAYVVKVENEEELWNTYNYIKSNISTNIESALSDGLEILIEEYIDGDEVDIDMLIQNGKVKFYSITDNYKTNEPFFIETGFAIPSSLPARDLLALRETAEDTLEKMGVQNGCVHFEAKSTKNGPVPIEVNLRMGGDEVYSFNKGAWNVDMIENAAKIACGIFIKINKPEVPRRYFAGQDFLVDNSGILVKIDIDEEIRKKKYLEELHFYKEIGDPVLVPPEGYEYLGWLTVSGDNPLDAEDNLADALKYINYKVVKFDTDSFFGKTARKNRFSSAVLKQDQLLRAAKIERIRSIASQNLKNLHIGVACNLSEDSGNKVEQEFVDTAKLIEKTLVERGYKVTLFDFDNLNKTFNDLRKSDVDLIFNVAESINHSKLLKPNIPAILEALQIPYTGSSSVTLSLAQDKIKFKKLLDYHNIPTPKWDYIESLEEEVSNDLRYPLIVKPSNTDRAFGITNESVVMDKTQLLDQLKKVIVDLNCPALVEEYIEGEEYDASILGSDYEDLEVLPLARSIFKGLPENYRRIWSQEARWGDDQAYQNIIVQRPPKNINKKLESLITEIALDTYCILDCQDYGRVEVRVDDYNNPYVLELNANPILSLESSLVTSAKLVNLDYGDLLEKIIIMTIKRYQHITENYKLSS
jgi:D-alanine-D-alanine ligase-like ATP-grasp enzyme